MRAGLTRGKASIETTTSIATTRSRRTMPLSSLKRREQPLTKKYKYSTIAKVVGFIFTMFIISAATSFFQHKSPTPADLIIDYVKQTGPTLPKLIGNGTRLDYLSPGNNKVTYHCTLVDVSSSDIRSAPGFANIISNFSAALKKQMCSTTEIRRLLDMGITLESEYRSSDQVVFTTLSVSGQDCK